MNNEDCDPVLQIAVKLKVAASFLLLSTNPNIKSEMWND